VGALAVFLLVVGAPRVSADPQPPADGVEVLQERPASGNDLRAPRAHNSPELAADPTDEEFVALANRLDNPDFSCALQVSGDGGRAWAPVDPVPQLPEGAEKCYAPQIAFDADGTLYYLFVALAGRGNRPVGVYLTTSTDQGRSFSPPRQVLGEGNYQVRMTIDRSVGERGRIHLVWLRTSQEPSLGGLPAPPNPIVAAHSDDGGETFSEPVQVSDPQRHARAVAPAVTVGVDGTLHVVHYDLRDDARDYQGLEGPVWQGHWSVVASTSRDAGESFEPSVVVDDAVVPPERVMLIFTMPPPAVAADEDGNVYAAWHDGRNDDWDAFAARSHDDGASWSGPVRINDDPDGGGAHQLLPQVSVAPDGRLDAVFFDRRKDSDNVAQHVYYAASQNRGQSFGSNVAVTRFSSSSQAGAQYAVPSAQGKVELGLGLALRSQNDGALAAWPDTRHALPGTAQQEIFTTLVRQETQPASTGLGWLAGAVAAGGVVAATGWGIRRRRRHRLRQSNSATEAATTGA
jgi:hypothetical protein